MSRGWNLFVLHHKHHTILKSQKAPLQQQLQLKGKLVVNVVKKAIMFIAIVVTIFKNIKLQTLKSEVKYILKFRIGHFSQTFCAFI